jgi:hypothetical protein
LYKIFNAADTCEAFHEPEPIGNGKVMRDYWNGKTAQMTTLADIKINKIHESVSEDKSYVETNHCFLKGFGWCMAESLPSNEVGIIILKRDRTKILQSFLKMDCTPITGFGRNWIYNPMMKNMLTDSGIRWTHYQLMRLIKLLYRMLRRVSRMLLNSNPDFPAWLTEFELRCLEWYVAEHEAQTRKFISKYPEIRYYEVFLEELQSEDRINEMFAYFGIHDTVPNEIIGTATNRRRGLFN